MVKYTGWEKSCHQPQLFVSSQKLNFINSQRFKINQVPIFSSIYKELSFLETYSVHVLKLDSFYQLVYDAQ